MQNEQYFRASDIFSHPAKGDRPARRGLLPIKRTQFYQLRKQGKFPPPDARIGDTDLWSGALLRATVARRENERRRSHSEHHNDME